MAIKSQQNSTGSITKPKGQKGVVILIRMALNRKSWEEESGSS